MTSNALWHTDTRRLYYFINYFITLLLMLRMVRNRFFLPLHFYKRHIYKISLCKRREGIGDEEKKW